MLISFHLCRVWWQDWSRRAAIFMTHYDQNCILTYQACIAVCAHVHVCVCVCLRRVHTVSHRCTIILDKPPGSAIRTITSPSPHHKYTCTIKGNTGFLSLQHWKLLEGEALGFRWGLSTCGKKAELLANAQLIKLWCVPSPCRSWASPLTSLPSPVWQCSACSSNYPQLYLCFISLDWVWAIYIYFFFS